jgi:hypothetical protein
VTITNIRADISVISSYVKMKKKYEDLVHYNTFIYENYNFIKILVAYISSLVNN